MPLHLLRLPFVGTALLLTLTAPAADDPLPPGAKTRFSVTRYILCTNPTVDLVPPSYTTFLAPTVAGGIRPYDLGAHRPLIKGGAIVGPGRVVASADGTSAIVVRPGARRRTRSRC
jgi:hypothetical protein